MDADAPVPAAEVDGGVDPAPASEGRLLAPERYREVVLRISHPMHRPYANVLYEGNNIVIRGPRRGEVYDADGNLVSVFTSIWRQEEPGVWRIVFDKGAKACP